MKLMTLSMRNFMPYKGESKLDFPKQEARNVMVVFGDNMRGKTSLLNAIRWAFYGRALGRHLREIPLHELLNKEAAEQGDFTLEIVVEFLADGHQYELRRRAEKRALVAYPQRPEDFEIFVGLLKDGSPVLGCDVEPEINHFAPEQVSRFFLFDGELLQDYESLLIEGDAQGKRIKESIEQVLGVPTLIHGRDEAETLLKIFQKQQQKDLSHIKGIERLAERQAEYQRRQEVLERDLASLREKLSQTKTDRITLDDELEKVDSPHRAKIQLDQHLRRQKEIVKRLGEISEGKRSVLHDAWRDMIQPRLTKRKRELYAEQERMTTLMDEKSSLEAKRNDLQKIIDNEVCPTCGGSTEASRRTEIERDLDLVKAALNKILIDHRSLGDINMKIRELDRINGSGAATLIRSLDEERVRLSIELTQVENNIEKLSDEIRGVDTADIARKRQRHDILLREEGRLERDVGNLDKEIEIVKRELAMIASSLDALPQARAQRSSAMVKACMAVEELFNGSIERLRKRLKDEVAGKATEAFLKLTTQHAYSGLQINDNYGLTILDGKRNPVTVKSAGAEQIVALSLIDGLARTGRAAGPLVMDTPFGRLDLKHRDNILRYLPTTTGQLILLVHNGELRREDLAPVAKHIGATYEIKEVSPRHSKIEMVLA